MVLYNCQNMVAGCTQGWDRQRPKKSKGPTEVARLHDGHHWVGLVLEDAHHREHLNTGDEQMSKSKLAAAAPASSAFDLISEWDQVLGLEGQGKVSNTK